MRIAFALLTMLIGGLVAALFVVSPVSAAGGDVFPAGTRYCADTFTWRTEPGDGRGHAGIYGGRPEWVVDLNTDGDSNMAVLVPGAGTVRLYSLGFGGGWGNSVEWISADGRERLHLAHLSDDLRLGLREVGQTISVRGGEQIGFVGRSGAASGLHLHVARQLDGEAAPVVLSGQPVVPAVDPAVYGHHPPGCNGTTYTSSGPGSALAPPAASPTSAPRGVELAIGVNNATVQWLAPAVDNGDAPSGYEVIVEPGQLRCSAGAAARSCVVTGINTDLVYTASVRARNGGGVSPEGVSAPTSSLRLPGPVSGPSVAVEARRAVVSWSGADGGSVGANELSVVVSIDDGQRACVAAPGLRSCVITGLQPTTTYEGVIVTRSVVGQSRRSVPIQFQTDAAPATSLAGRVSATSTSLTVSWDERPVGTTDPMLGYLVDVRLGARGVGGCVVGAAEERTCTIDRLDPATDYSITLAAQGLAGRVGEETFIGATTAVEPGPVTNVQVDARETSVAVRWEEPAAEGTDPIHSYVVTIDGAPPCQVVAGRERLCVIGGLDAGLEYRVSVRARTQGLLVSAPVRQIFRTTVPPPAGPVMPTPSVPGVIGDATTLDELLAAADYEASDADMLRLYVAFFGREPDVAGAIYWIGVLRDGASLAEVADYFTGVPEFERRYGETTNAVFLAEVYRNVLGRSVDQEGFDYWLRFLDAGELSRGGVVMWITQSAEFRQEYPFAPSSSGS